MFTETMVMEIDGRSTVFKTGAFNRSATHPQWRARRQPPPLGAAERGRVKRAPVACTHVGARCDHDHVRLPNVAGALPVKADVRRGVHPCRSMMPPGGPVMLPLPHRTAAREPGCRQGTGLPFAHWRVRYGSAEHQGACSTTIR